MGDLLFCDTFDHEGEKELHVDLVHFNAPVILKEVRIVQKQQLAHIALETRGLTSPDSFNLTVYCNDTNNPLASTFQLLGKLDYRGNQTAALPLKTETKSDMVVVQGLYTSLTLCLYGTVPSHHHPPPHPLQSGPHPLQSGPHPLQSGPHPLQSGPHPLQSGPLTPRSASPYSDAHSPQNGGRPAPIPHKESQLCADPLDARPLPVEGTGEETAGHTDEGKGRVPVPADSYDELFESFSPVNSPDHLFDLSDEELGPGTKRGSTVPAAYEEFSDEEIAFPDVGFDMEDGGGLDPFLYGEDAWLTSPASFNPYQCVFGQLESFPRPWETPHEALTSKLAKSDITTASKQTVSFEEAAKLKETVAKIKETVSQKQVFSQQSSTTWKTVEQIEEIPTLLYPGLAQISSKSRSEEKEIFDTLVNLAVQSITLSNIQHLPPILNIRYLKAGLKMTLTSAELGQHYTYSLVKHGTMELLCTLIGTRHVASSIKLTVLKCLDTLTDYPQGMERFVSWNLRSSSQRSLTPYQCILKLTLVHQTVRVLSAMTALLKKAHFYELLGNLQQAVDKVVACAPLPLDALMKREKEPEDKVERRETVQIKDDRREGEKGEEKGGEEEKEKDGGNTAAEVVKKDKEMNFDVSLVKEEPMDVTATEGSKVDEDMDVKQDQVDQQSSTESVTAELQMIQVQPLPDEVMKTIVCCLEELKKCLDPVSMEIVQPPAKAFPTAIKFFPGTSGECFPGVARLLKCRRFLECLLVILTSPVTSLEPVLFGGVRDLLLQLVSFQQGLLFLCGEPEIMNAISRALIQPLQDNEMPLSTMQPLSDFTTSGDLDSCSAQNLGLLINYHLQVYQSLDVLRKASTKSSMVEMESNEYLGALHTLYSMSLTNIGKSTLTFVLSLKDNLATLLPFVEPRGQKDHDNKLTKSSISSRYAAVMILQLLQSSVRGDFLLNYGTKLMGVAEFFKDNSSPTMSDLYNWVRPVTANKSIPLLVNIIRESVNMMSCTRQNKGNAPILTSLRILLAIVIPPSRPASETDTNSKELKWTEELINLFSAGAMDVLITLFQKLTELVLPMWRQRLPLSVANANILVLITKFGLQLVKALLSEVLCDSVSSYKDTRILKTLLSLHTVFCSIPFSSIISNAVPELQNLIVDIFSLFLRPDEIPEEEGKSLGVTTSWDLVLHEVFEHIQSSPHNILSGLMLLSQFLPVPLPVQAPPSVQMFAEVIGKRAVALRKVWATSFMPLMDRLPRDIDELLHSSCAVLHQTLRRVCAQLSDLGPNLASVIASRLILLAVTEIDKQDSGVKEEAEKEGEAKKDSSSLLLRTLTTCAVLCQQGSFKTALLNLLKRSNGESKDDKDGSETKLYSRFIGLLLFTMQKKETHPSVKICVLTILTALANVYISLNSLELGGGTLTNQQLSNCLPSQSQLEQITSAILGHVTSPDQPLATITLGLKFLISLCQYKAGIVQLYSLLHNTVSRFPLLLDRTVKALRASGTLSEDVLPCVSMLLELIQSLRSSELTAKDGSSFVFPKSLIKVMVVSDEGTDLLLMLRDTVKEVCKSDEVWLETLCNDAFESLEDVVPYKAGTSENLMVTESPIWPEMHDLETLFELRAGVMVTENPSPPEYWLSSSPHNENEIEAEAVQVDLLQLASGCCPNLNLGEELKKQLLPSPPSSPKNERKRKPPITGSEAQKRLKMVMEARANVNRGKDLFRLRKQNTSRPPSMHVDDFMAMGPGGMGRGGGGTQQSSLVPPLGMPYLPLLPQFGAARWPLGVAGLGQYNTQRRDVGVPPWDPRISILATATAHAAKAQSMKFWIQAYQLSGRGPGGNRSSGGSGGSGGSKQATDASRRHSAAYKRPS